MFIRDGEGPEEAHSLEPAGSTPAPARLVVPIVLEHAGVMVVRDDLLGGTKARFLDRMFDGADEAVYASPAEGGAPTALTTVARQLGKRATIFVAARSWPHARTLEAARLGGRVVEVRPGYLSVVQAAAERLGGAEVDAFLRIEPEPAARGALGVEAF